MKRSSEKSWVSGTVIRKLFPELEHHSIDALTAVWDEVVDQVIIEMMTLSEANKVELHINVREDMVMELVQLQFWLAERVVEKRVAGRELSSIDPEQEREECLGSEGADIIHGTARMVHERIWSRRLEERRKPKSAKAIEREANPKLAKLAVKPVGKNHFISRWFIRDHWATEGKVLRWRRTPDGWTSSKRGIGLWGYPKNSTEIRLRPISACLKVTPSARLKCCSRHTPSTHLSGKLSSGFLLSISCATPTQSQRFKMQLHP